MICINCIHLAPLKKYVASFGEFICCDYCQAESICVKDIDIFDYIADRLRESYRIIDELTQYEQIAFYHGSDQLSITEYWSPLQEDYDIADEEFVEKLINYLEEDFAVDEEGQTLLYVLDDGSLETNTFEIAWENFISKIHHTHRFFNDGAKKFLDSVFNFACNDNQLKPELITSLSTTDSLFRARKAANYQELTTIESDPAQQLGPAPAHRAGNQRMTPSGISAMYCARDRETCLSEIRAVTGDLVITGEFNPITNMGFLDLRKLEEIARFDLHPFDEGFTKASHGYHFLKGLIFKLSKPKGNNDDFGYISTQVVFEYLRVRFNRVVGGIIFPSVQTGFAGVNVVVFPECCLIAPPGYSIENEDPIGNHDFWAPAIPSLAFNPGSLMVHKIKAVRTEADIYKDSAEYQYKTTEKRR